MNKKWIFQFGIHKGTLMSRDVGENTSFDSEEELMTNYREGKAFYATLGYKYWYAYKISPEGIKTLIEQNPYY